jgi:uncharacterized protein (DUF1810 family)
MSDAADPHDLNRFVAAQDEVWPQVTEELRAGRKRTHWMWFVFPQLAGLGRSATAQFYGIAGLDEARAYIAHPVLGARLRQCCRWVLESRRPVHDILGSPDDLKLCSSATLFAVADPAEPIFAELLATCFEGHPDAATLELLGRMVGEAGRSAD